VRKVLKLMHIYEFYNASLDWHVYALCLTVNLRSGCIDLHVRYILGKSITQSESRGIDLEHKCAISNLFVLGPGR